MYNFRYNETRMVQVRQFKFDYLSSSTNCFISLNHTQPAFNCSKLTIETLEKGVKYVQS